MSDLAKIAAAVSVKTLVMRVGQYAGPIGTVHLGVPVDIAAKMAGVGHVEGLTAEDAAEIADHLAKSQKEIVDHVVDRVDAALVPTTAEPAQFTATAVAPPELINTPAAPVGATPEPEPIKPAPATEPTSATTDATSATTDATTAKVKATKAKAAPKAQAADK